MFSFEFLSLTYGKTTSITAQPLLKSKPLSVSFTNSKLFILAPESKQVNRLLINYPKFNILRVLYKQKVLHFNR